MLDDASRTHAPRSCRPDAPTGAPAATDDIYAFADTNTEFGPRRPWRNVAWNYALLGSDMLAMACTFVTAFLVAGLTNNTLFGREYLVTSTDVSNRIIVFTFLSLVMLGYLHRRGHYLRRLMFDVVLRDLVRITLFGMLIDGFVQFSLQQVISRAWFAYTWTLLPLFVLGLRQVTRGLLTVFGLWRRRVVIAGEPGDAGLVQAALLSDGTMGYEIAGRVGIPSMLGKDGGKSGAVGAKVMPPAAAMRRFGADLLVFAPGDEPFQLRRTLIAELVREHVAFAIMPSLEGLPVAGYHPQHFYRHDMMLLSYRSHAESPFARGLKVALDVLGAGLLVLLLAPAIALIAVLIKRDGGPVFFAHTRLGYDGRKFGCLKFRTMVMNADAVLREHLAQHPRAAAEWAATQKLRRDPRITGIGALLRKTSLDELPQLINVLRLDMSLVGPRPIVEREAVRYGEEIAFYSCVRPGLTGLWQVSGRNDTSYGRKVQLDAYYVKNWSFWGDLVILAKTIPAVVLRRGAF